MREKPWYRKDRGLWYVQVGGRQYLLAKGPRAETEGAAWARYHELMAELGRTPDGRPAPITTSAVVIAFLAATRGRVKPSTFYWYGRHLKPLVVALGGRPATDLRPIEVMDWLAGQPIVDSTRHGRVGAAKRAFSWAKRVGLLNADPLAGLERPRMGRRSPAMRPGDAERLIAGAKYPDFRDLLTALRETGARPSEVAAVTAADYRPAAACWVLAAHKAAEATGRPRVVYLTAGMVALTERLAAERPAGPLFLNRRRRPWTRNAIAYAFRRLAKRIGLDGAYTPYSLRKSFATDALALGVPVAQVAELMGHRSTAMLERHYSHLSDRGEVLRSAAGRARGAGPADGGPAGRAG